MRIHFEFSGGYGGLFAKQPLAYDADTDELPDAVRERLIGLIRSSGVLELPPESGRRGPQRDVFNYELSIEAEGVSKHVRLDDASATPAVRPLLKELRQLAVERRMAGRRPGS